MLSMNQEEVLWEVVFAKTAMGAALVLTPLLPGQVSLKHGETPYIYSSSPATTFNRPIK